MDDVQIFLLTGIVFLIALLVTIFASDAYDGMERTENALTMTCDELYLESAYEYRVAAYKQCVKPIFPDGYDDVDLIEYFGSMECKELGIHIIKKHFEHEEALDIYHVKCPGEPLNFDDIIFEKSKPDVTPENWIKSDESNYGKQYKDIEMDISPISPPIGSGKQ